MFLGRWPATSYTAADSCNATLGIICLAGSAVVISLWSMGVSGLIQRGNEEKQASSWYSWVVQCARLKSLI